MPIALEAERGQDGRPRESTRRRVLVIEDDRDIAEAISYQLEKSGLAVRVAQTGEEGLDLARRGVDLVLLDLNLPGVDGLEVCRSSSATRRRHRCRSSSSRHASRRSIASSAWRWAPTTTWT